MATYNPAIHHRRSIRLKGYDYSQAGLYFITICVENRLLLFGHIENGSMILNDAGNMVTTVWNEIPTHYPGFRLHEFVVMPNHFHGIIETVGAGPRACPNHTSAMSVSDIVHRFKTMSTKRYADGVKAHGWPPFPGRLWQRNYYEHIIRSAQSLNRVREYIVSNPLRWELDRENPLRPIHGSPQESDRQPPHCNEKP